ncbi:hypothetical protein ACGFI4_15830 [Micromonospora carbonacea]|jgi:hypothetical protein|uniref:Uncharacterized protein n=1 Tax=Micromonospora carbonacea TaxID=47853 RepID=A0A1C4YSZ1_9ACTN|nr:MULTISPECIES: hypothetical protein [Micromonospora]MBB5829329.1 hypothetical protein [Micromonospora carbonacea]MDG4816736.1 hypothetical protein [Micromonospora sp. WMMD956]QLD23217.1 hypothetical protein HXZ27_02390 [Micromonospora carbonacea]WFE59229.1 hypothetical protein O7633_21370 [Micromonospora sp. WMMD712]SCF23865.1 hypothetical protein GA0070563_106411 [Micromonospora carbonacea]
MPESVPVPVPAHASAASEPLLTVGGVTAAGAAVLSLLVAFGLPVSADQQTALLGLVAVLAPLVVAVLARGRVYSPATVADLLARRR